MIRINLLPYKESTLIQWGQRQVLIYLVSLVTALGLAGYIYTSRPDPEAGKKTLLKQRQDVMAKTGSLRGRKTCSRSKYQSKIKSANRKFKAVHKLITNRKSPRLVMRELSRVLSGAWGPTIKPALMSKKKGTLFNANWDPTAVWLTRYEEKDRTVQLEGGARAMDDVGEILARLKASAYFYGVDLEKIVRVPAKSEKEQPYLRFSMLAGVRY